MTKDLSRLLRPQSVAVIGGGAWCQSVIDQLERFGDEIAVWPVNPKGGKIGNISIYKGISELSHPPDAAFIGINRDATIPVVEDLRKIGAGGAVCFASGFAEVFDGSGRNQALLDAAGEMPILGPNCYGYINALDGALLWPDQHGCVPVESGVAILTQSSNIAINLTMQQRALPIAYVVTCGNQAQTSQAEIAMSLLDDDRVTAIGLHVEGFGVIAHWQAFARKARDQNIPVVAIKVGRSDAAQTAAISHTASLAGGDAGAQALLDRLGIARVDDLPTFLETLKLLHHVGHLPSNRIATISCSGGEASLAADLAESLPLTFPELNSRQTADLSQALGPKVALANPLDYHTYIWRDIDAMTDAFSAMLDPVFALTMLIVDFPRPDRCDPSDWDCVIAAAIRAKARGDGNLALVATLPECLPEPVARELAAGEVIPLNGLTEALAAAAAAKLPDAIDLSLDLLQGKPVGDPRTLSEAEAKTALNAFGLLIPRALNAATPAEARSAARALTPPLVLKGTRIAHKTEHGAVHIGLLDAEAVGQSAENMPSQGYLVEEMVGDPVTELLIGVTHDPAHGFVLTIGAGGVLTEILQDAQSLLVPSSDVAIRRALKRLNCSQLLVGYRGKPGANIDAVVGAILAIQDYALANAAHLAEVEVNPLICTPTAAIAADALIRIADDQRD